MYGDDESTASVEVPVGSFFAMGWGKYSRVSSLAVCVNPGSAFNSYWPMPFRKRAQLTLENLGDEPMTFYYQIDHTEAAGPEDGGYSHAQYRRVNPVPYNRFIRSLKAWAEKGNTLALILNREFATTDGGAKARSSST